MLTLGTAVAGTLMYGQGSGGALESYAPASSVALELPSQATIEMWKATGEFVRLHRAESTDLNRTVRRVTGNYVMCPALARARCRQLTTDLRTVR